MIDSHHHIWRQADLPWLLGPEQARIFGEYAAIKRDYLIEEYLTDIRSSQIEKSVYVQSNWSPNWAADEAAWVQGVADLSGWPHAIVGYADFTSSDIEQQLYRLSQYPLVRGVRQQLHWHENPIFRFAAKDNIAADKQFQKNVSLLANYDYSFDLQLFPGQLTHGICLANACPKTTFILQHAGMLHDTSKAGWKLWKNAMSKLAKCENVMVKLSGLGTFVHAIDQALIDRIVLETVSMFGAERCMFGSNIPIEKIWTDYQTLFDAFRKATASLSCEEQDFIFNDTAQRVYRIGD